MSNTIASNARTIAGVTSNVTLIGIKVMAYNPATGSASGSIGAVLSGILWAADHGADVANMSLGGGFAKAGNSASDLDHNGNILSTYCAAPNVVCVSATGPTSQGSVNGPFYNGSQGTSMSAPHVSGLAALLVNQVGHGHPSQIKARLRQGADDLGQVGVDPFYGKGRINVPETLGLPY